MKRAANWAFNKASYLGNRALGAAAGTLGALALKRYMFKSPLYGVIPKKYY